MDYGDSGIRRTHSDEKNEFQIPDDAAERLNNQAIQLPLWPDSVVAMPNRLAKSSLFTAIRRGRREMVDDELIVSPAGTTIYFSGKRLDITDSDVYMAVLDFCKGQAVFDDKNVATISKYALLQKLNRSDGGAAYKALTAQLDRLIKASVKVVTNNYAVTFHLIEQIYEDKVNHMYGIRLNPDVVMLFKNNEFAYIDWDKRMQLAGPSKDLAKWLQLNIMSHSNDCKFLVDTIRISSGYSATPVRKFRFMLKKALCELQRLEIIASFGVDDRLVTWCRIVE